LEDVCKEQRPGCSKALKELRWAFGFKQSNFHSLASAQTGEQLCKTQGWAGGPSSSDLEDASPPTWVQGGIFI